MESRVPLSYPETRPRVVHWFRIYCICLTVLYLVVALLSAALAVIGMTQEVEDAETMIVIGVAGAIVCLPFAVVFLIGALLKPRPWVWIYSIVLIALGLTSLCTLPFCIALLIYWLKPDVRAWYGRL